MTWEHDWHDAIMRLASVPAQPWTLETVEILAGPPGHPSRVGTLLADLRAEGIIEPTGAVDSAGNPIWKGCA